MQAPNGKFYFKKYNSNGDSIFCSEVIYKTELEAHKAMKEHDVVEEEKLEVKAIKTQEFEVEKEAPKAVKKTVKKTK